MAMTAAPPEHQCPNGIATVQHRHVIHRPASVRVRRNHERFRLVRMVAVPERFRGVHAGEMVVSDASNWNIR